MSEQWIDRNLNLKDKRDRDYFLKKLEMRQNLPVTVGQVEEAISFLQRKLDEEWLTLYPFYSSAHVSVKTGAKSHQALDFFSIVLRLGFALLALEESKGSDRLIAKLNLHSFDRLSAIVEIICAARYKTAGYDIELEPSTWKGKFCDFRVRFNDEWIYFECKKESFTGSRYFQKASRFADNLIDLVLSGVEHRLPITHRIDIRLHRQPQRSELPKLVNSISNCIDAGQFSKWKRVGETEFALNPRGAITPHPTLTAGLFRATVETAPKPITQLANIQVVFDPFGSKELQKARRLIREARVQLPQDSKSIMVLESLHPKRIVRIAEEKLKQAGYENVIAILVVGDVPTGKERFLTLNASHLSFPLDFLKVGISPSPI